MSQTPERLNKILAQSGLGSRRSVDNLIVAKRITVNNRPAQLGEKVTASDVIKFDGKVINHHKPERILIAFNKPRGITTTKKDPHAKVTVMNFLPKQYQHLNPIGRLDRDSRGLLLFTNDGDLALRLEHPRFKHEKEYKIEFVPINKKRAETFTEDIKRLKHEIIDPEIQSKPPTVLDSSFDPVKQSGKATVILQEGRKRQIRRLFSVLGYTVTDLLRTRVNSVTLARLKEGEYATIDLQHLKL